MADNESNRYEEKQEARRQRYEERAAKARAESDAAYQQARRMAEVIPMGQPILVGHHSEQRDRNYRARIWRKQDASVALAKKADHYEAKAAAVGKGGISPDDPEAVRKLRDELARLEQMREKMKQANSLVRRKDRDGLAALGFSEIRIGQLFTPDFCGRIGFPDYALQNNGANIRRIRQRIESLEKKPTESTERQDEEVTIREDADENRIMLIFLGKPSESIRDILKSAGFKWSPTRGAWVRFLNNAGRAAARYVMEKIKGVS